MVKTANDVTRADSRDAIATYTHAAAVYHFGDRASLLTAVAAEGYRLLAEALCGA